MIGKYIQAFNEFADVSIFDDADIKQLGNCHIEAAKLIVESPKLSAKLKEDDLEVLQNKVIEFVKSLSLS